MDNVIFISLFYNARNPFCYVIIFIDVRLAVYSYNFFQYFPKLKNFSIVTKVSTLVCKTASQYCKFNVFQIFFDQYTVHCEYYNTEKHRVESIFAYYRQKNKIIIILD